MKIIMSRCALGDKLWAFNNTKLLPHAVSVELRSNVKLSAEPISILFPYCMSISSPGKVHIIRAPSAEDLASWLAEIHSKIVTKTDNDVLSMAEMIICDEESARLSRVQEAVAKALELNVRAVGSVSTSLSSSSDRAPLVETDKLRDNYGETQDDECEDSEAFYQCRVGIQTSASEGNVNSNKMHGNCLLLTRRTRARHRELELLFGFCNAVQNYRELHRHDTRATMEPWCQWTDAVQIFDQYLDSTLENVRTVSFGGVNGYTEVKKANLLDALPDWERETAKVIVSRIQDELFSALRKHLFGLDDPALQQNSKIHSAQTRRRRVGDVSGSSMSALRFGGTSTSSSHSISPRWAMSGRSFWSWMSNDVDLAPVAPVSRRKDNFDDGLLHYIERTDGNIYLILDKFKRPPAGLFDELTGLVDRMTVSSQDSEQSKHVADQIDGTQTKLSSLSNNTYLEGGAHFEAHRNSSVEEIVDFETKLEVSTGINEADIQI